MLLSLLPWCLRPPPHRHGAAAAEKDVPGVPRRQAGPSRRRAQAQQGPEDVLSRRRRPRRPRHTVGRRQAVPPVLQRQRRRVEKALDDDRLADGVGAGGGDPGQEPVRPAHQGEAQAGRPLQQAARPPEAEERGQPPRRPRRLRRVRPAGRAVARAREAASQAVLWRLPADGPDGGQRKVHHKDAELHGQGHVQARGDVVQDRQLLRAGQRGGRGLRAAGPPGVSLRPRGGGRPRHRARRGHVDSTAGRMGELQSGRMY